MIHDMQRARRALEAYQLPPFEVVPLLMGNINETYIVQAGPTRYILQRLNPIFDPQIHFDIDCIAAVLQAHGLLSPRLIRSRQQTLWVNDPEGGVWRLQTYIDGIVYSAAATAELCEPAGRLLGRFHCALSNLEHTFRAPRTGVHDTARHLQGLRDALQKHSEHKAYVRVAPLAASILMAADSLPSMHGVRARVVHGDPKINNIVFNATGEAIAMIDLDTLSHMPVPLELGDALRSWCNPAGEESGEAAFSLPHFTAALTGYAAGARGLLRENEIALLPAALETIALELASRFARDALEERYFGWDPSRFATAWEHNLRRAESQWALAMSYAAQRGLAVAVIKRLFHIS